MLGPIYWISPASRPHKSCFRATLIIRNYRTILITRPSSVIIMLTQINRAPPLPSFSIDIFMEANISSRIQWRFITIRRIIRSSGKNKKFHSLNSTGCIFSSKNIPSSPWNFFPPEVSYDYTNFMVLYGFLRRTRGNKWLLGKNRYILGENRGMYFLEKSSPLFWRSPPPTSLYDSLEEFGKWCNL